MLKALLRKAACRALVGPPGGLSVIRRVRRRSVVIVMYHGVVENSLPVFNWCQLHRDDFEKQVAFLSEEYRIFPLQEIIDRLSRGLSLPERAVCLTFDDGFRNVLRTAYPILCKYQAPATVFLVTSLVGALLPPWPEQLYCAIASTKLKGLDFEGQKVCLASHRDRLKAFDNMCLRLMSLPVEKKEVLLEDLLVALGKFSFRDYDALGMLNWDEVKELDASGLVSFGSHTHTHQIMSRCTPGMQYCELLASRKLMLEHVGRADLFAYPNGRAADYTDDTKRLLCQLGYRCGLTTIRGVNTSRSDRYELKRVGVGADLSFSDFQFGMLGW